MNSAFVVSVLVFLCIASAIAQPAIPDLPVQFQAKIQMTMPFIGQVPAIMYYDYLNNRVRYDATAFGQTATTIQRYDIETPTEFDVNNGECLTLALDGPMNSMAIPPFASYVGSENVDSISCDHWTVDFFGINLDWWVSNSTDSDGKVSYQLVRFSESAIGSQIDFSATIPGPVNYSYFDVSKYGCTPPPPPVTYTIAGYVKNAINNQIISGANVTISDTIFTTSDVNGKYQFDSLLPSNYTIHSVASGFFQTSKVITITSDSIPLGTIGDFSLSPILSSGQIRAVLTWGAQPFDLDAHLKTPSGCEVYYYRRTCGTSSLDVDQRQGFGPETVTINGLATSGTYTYYVINYSGEKPLTVSNGRVQVYGSNGLIADFSVPTDSSSSTYKYWSGFTVDQTGKVTVVNKLTPSM